MDTSKLPFNDRTDFEDADRGYIGALEPCIIKDDNGKVIWNNDAFAFPTFAIVTP